MQRVLQECMQEPCSTRAFHRCHSCGLEHARLNNLRQKLEAQRPAIDECMDCHCVLIHPGRKNTDLTPNITKRQWNAKKCGDRRCTKCAEEHATKCALDHMNWMDAAALKTTESAGEGPDNVTHGGAPPSV